MIKDVRSKRITQTPEEKIKTALKMWRGHGRHPKIDLREISRK